MTIRTLFAEPDRDTCLKRKRRNSIIPSFASASGVCHLARSVGAFRLPDDLFHLADGPFHADQNRAGNDTVADVQFLDAPDATYGLNIGVIEPMSEMDVQPLIAGKDRRLFQDRQLPAASIRRARFRIAGRLELD